jgi:adenine deaminase
MKRNLAIFLLALSSACHPGPSYEFVIRNVGLFDGEKDLGIVNIAINGDTIAAISKDPLDGDSMLEASGKYLIPGLVNSHVHIWELEQLKEGYDAGVLAHMGMHASNPVRDSTI